MVSHRKSQFAWAALASGLCWLGIAPTLASGQEPILVVRISERLLSDLLREPVTETSQVNTVILGAPVHGQAFTYGRVYIDCVPSPRQAKLWLLFGGYTWANLVGHRSPAHVHSRTATRFVAGKELTYDTSDALDMQPARVASRTHRTTRGIASEIPGLRGWVVRRMASKRLARKAGAIDAQTHAVAQHRVEQSFERHIQEQLGPLRERLAELTPRLQQAINNRGYLWNIATSEEYLVLAAWEQNGERTPSNPSLEGLTLPRTPHRGALLEVWRYDQRDQTSAESLERGLDLAKLVLRVLVRTDTVPEEYQDNFVLLGRLKTTSADAGRWDVVQLHDPQGA